MYANITIKVRKEVYQRDGYRCALCDSTHYIQVHHAVPRSQGGSSKPMNLITLCMECHALAHGTKLQENDLTQEDVEQAIVVYLADYYEKEWWPYKSRKHRNWTLPF